MEVTIVLTDDEWKAMEAEIIDPAQWIIDAVKNKTRKCVDVIIQKNTDKQPAKLIYDDKLLLIKDMILKTRAEIEAENEIKL